MYQLTDKEFLVLTRPAAASLRRLLDDPLAQESDLRAMILAATRTAKLLRLFPAARGLTRVLQLDLKKGYTLCVGTFVWGRSRDGGLKLSPDGKRQVVYLSEVLPWQGEVPCNSTTMLEQMSKGSWSVTK